METVNICMLLVMPLSTANITVLNRARNVPAYRASATARHDQQINVISEILVYVGKNPLFI